MAPYIALVIFVLSMLYLIWALSFSDRIKLLLKNKPERVEQVEVAGKRIIDRDEVYTRYLVVFKFSDGSVKELKVGAYSERAIYDSIQEGDTGKLIYKEIDNIEQFKDEDDRRVRRLFIRFEKDS